MSKYATLDADTLTLDQVRNLDLNLNRLLYKVRVPFMYTLTASERALYGSPADSDGKPLKDQEESYTTVYWPFSRILETYSSGGNIRIVSPEDVKGIYILMEEYLDIQTAILHSLFKDQYMDKPFIKNILDLRDYLSTNEEIKAICGPEMTLLDIAEAIHTPSNITATPEIDYGELRELVKFTPTI